MDGEGNLKKSQCVLHEGNEVKYAFIRDHVECWPVVNQCRVLSMKRSTYYDWLNRPAKVIPAEELAQRLRMMALFTGSQESLGSRMIMEQLRAEGLNIGREHTHADESVASEFQAEA